MALLVPNCGEIALLSRMLNKTAASNVSIGLYTENVTPGEATVATDVDTLAPDTRGYDLQELTGANWDVAEVGETGVIRAVYDSMINFVFTSDSTYLDVHGYKVLADDGTLLWAERFIDGPYRVPAGGGTISITPRIELD